MTTLCCFCAGWLVLSTLFALWFWAAAVLGKRDDEAHGRGD